MQQTNETLPKTLGIEEIDTHGIRQINIIKDTIPKYIQPEDGDCLYRTKRY